MLLRELMPLTTAAKLSLWNLTLGRPSEVKVHSPKGSEKLREMDL